MKHVTHKDPPEKQEYFMFGILIIHIGYTSSEPAPK